MTTRHQRLSWAAAALVAAGGAIHLQQWLVRMRDVPTIGPMFLLNVAASALVAVLLLVRPSYPSIGAGLAVSVGTLAALVVARYETLFGYREPTWRSPATAAVVVELAASACLVILAASLARTSTRAASASGTSRRARLR